LFPKRFKGCNHLFLEDAFEKAVTLEKSSEQINELETKGGFYTEEEMRTELKYKPHLSFAIGISVLDFSF